MIDKRRNRAFIQGISAGPADYDTEHSGALKLDRDWNIVASMGFGASISRSAGIPTPLWALDLSVR
jgi:hypothetical protein